MPFTRERALAARAAGDIDLADLVERLLDEGRRSEGESYDVIFLSPPTSPLTVHLKAPVVNDTLTAAGRPWGWTLSQRYTRLDKLTSGVTRTSEL